MATVFSRPLSHSRGVGVHKRTGGRHSNGACQLRAHLGRMMWLNCLVGSTNCVKEGFTVRS